MSIEFKQMPDAVQDHHETFHDIRQPVASVLALAAAVLTEPDLPVAARGRREQIVGETEWLTDIVHACLTAYGQEEPYTTRKSDEGWNAAAASAAAALPGKPEGSEEVERVQWGRMGMLENGPGGLSAPEDVSPVTTGSSLRELCHDLIEPTAAIRWLVRAAEAESGEELRDRLEAIAAAAGQIAAICDDILDPPRCRPRVRLDKIAAEVVASARARYAGVIDVVSQPVTALACTGDIIRILCNILANACRAAGPVGRIAVEVDEADGQARLTIADSGHGLAGAAVGGRAGLGLEIIGALALKYGGSVHLGVSDLGGLAVTVQVPAQGRSSN